MRTVKLNGKTCAVFSPSIARAYQVKALAARMGAVVRTKDEALRRFSACGVQYLANDGRELVALDPNLKLIALFESRAL